MERFLFPSSSDRLASMLTSLLVELYDLHRSDIESGKCELEIEGRIGRILDVETQSRIRLPVEGEAVIIRGEANSLQSLRFEAGLPSDKSRILEDKILSSIDSNPDVKLTASFSTDVSHHLKGNQGQVRKSTYHDGNDKNILKEVAITKEKLRQLDVYSGKNENEDFGEEFSPYDLRVTINIERQIESNQIGDPTGFVRNRKRRSYCLGKDHRIDITTVLSGDDDNASHEFEFELRPKWVKKAVDSGSQQDSTQTAITTKFKNSVAEFLHIGRAAVKYLTDTVPTRSLDSCVVQNREWADLSECTKNEIEKKAYTEFISKAALPIIGDYCFRVAKRKKLLGVAPPLAETMQESLVPEKTEIEEPKISTSNLKIEESHAEQTLADLPAENEKENLEESSMSEESEIEKMEFSSVGGKEPRYTALSEDSGEEDEDILGAEEGSEKSLNLSVSSGE
eukprot:GHVP01021415.1.p1 GENE.GHVP01021415.1~~GHVP01021415.1.p1  ORF type:complete len:462 (+),score=118.73 GHVP01021415.1:28-1386(+)